MHEDTLKAIIANFIDDSFGSVEEGCEDHIRDLMRVGLTREQAIVAYEEISEKGYWRC